mgnify:CR=1 FL=1
MKSDWQVKKLSDIVEFNPTERLSKGAIAKKISMDMLQPFTKDVFQYELQPYNGGAKFRNGDTIMARITPCLENGKVSKVNILTKGEVGFGSTEYIVLRAIPNVSDPDFIYYLTISDFVRAPAIKSMVGSSGRQRVQQNVLETLKLPLPPYDEQKKIAAILSALDEKIAINRAINENLEWQAQAIYSSMFIDNPDSAWSHGHLSDLITVKYGKDHKKLADGIYPVYGSGGIMRYVERPLYDKESVLIPRKGTLNNVMYVNQPFWSVDTMFYTEMKLPNVAKFVYHFVKAKDLASMNAGSAVPSMTTDILNAMEVVIPSASALEEFESLVAPMYEAMEANDVQSKALSQMRDTLLPKLMSGEIDVSDVQL